MVNLELDQIMEIILSRAVKFRAGYFEDSSNIKALESCVLLQEIARDICDMNDGFETYIDYYHQYF